MKCEQVAQVSFSPFIVIIPFQCIVRTARTTAYPLSILIQMVVITVSFAFIAIIVVIHGSFPPSLFLPSRVLALTDIDTTSQVKDRYIPGQSHTNHTCNQSRDFQFLFSLSVPRHAFCNGLQFPVIKRRLALSHVDKFQFRINLCRGVARVVHCSCQGSE